MSTPDGPPDTSGPDEPTARPTPTPPQYGQYGQPGPPEYGQPGAPQHGQPGPPQYGQYGQPGAPQYGQPGPPQYGQYGQPGPPPSAPPVGPSGTTTPALRVGEALAFGWVKFTRNWVTWLLFAVIAAIILGALNAPLIGDYVSWLDRVLDGVRRGADVTDLPMPSVTAGAQLLGLVGALASLLVQVVAWHAALREADGVRPSLGDFVTVRRLGLALLAAIVVNVIAAVAAFIPFGAIAWAIFTVFVVAFVVDRGLGAFAALGAGMRLVAKNFGSVLLLLLALLGINVVGALLAGVGLLVSLPVSILALSYAFRRLTGGTIV